MRKEGGDAEGREEGLNDPARHSCDTGGKGKPPLEQPTSRRSGPFLFFRQLDR